MKNTHTISREALRTALVELSSAAAHAAVLPKGGKLVVRDICTAVANIIVGAGRDGSHEQLAMMDAASAAGFTPEFYASSVRVSYIPK